jgi:8-oxo-dGTP diphosphatase
MTDWTPPPPVIYAADMVLFAEMEEITASVLLIERGNEPFKGRLALPGGYVEAGKETGEDAALRETEGETGIAVSAAFTATLSARVEPRAGDDAKNARWVLLSELDLRQLAFDHGRIVREALALNGVTLSDFR